MLFSSLYDTGDRAPAEIAEALLQVHTFGRQKPSLTAMHAVNSSLILDRCCNDADFLALVDSGHIKFLARPGGEKPSQLFQRVLSLPDAQAPILRSWPELATADARAAAQVFLKDGKPTGLSDQVDQRLENLKRLTRAIEGPPTRPKVLEQEQRYKVDILDEFAKCVHRVERLPVFNSDLLQVLRVVANEQSNTTRTALYRHIRRLCPGESETAGELRGNAEKFVDAASYVQVATALQVPLYTIDNDMGMVWAHDTPSASDVSVLDSTLLNKTEALRIRWSDVKSVVTPLGQGERGEFVIEAALASLASILAARSTKDVANWYNALKAAQKEFIKPLPPVLVAGGSAILFHGDVGQMMLAAFATLVGQALFAAGMEVTFAEADKLHKVTRLASTNDEAAQILKGWSSVIAK